MAAIFSLRKLCPRLCQLTVQRKIRSTVQLNLREKGATAVEYALMVGLIGVGITAAVTNLQTKMSYTLKNVIPSAHNFAFSDFGGYVNSPTIVGNYVRLKTVNTIPTPGGPYHTGVGYVVIPPIVRSGPLQWAILSCSPNNAGVLYMGVQSGWGDTNQLSLPVAVPNNTFGWTKSATVAIQATGEKPTNYLVIPTDTANLEVQLKELVLGQPVELDRYIADHPASGTC